MPGYLTTLFSFPRQMAFLMLATLLIPAAARAQLPLEVITPSPATATRRTQRDSLEGDMTVRTTNEPLCGAFTIDG